MTGVSNQIIRKATGIDINEVKELTEKEIKDRDITLGNAVFKEYSEKKDLFDKLNESLKSYVSNIATKPIYVLVDELDRTRPDYAVKFIETLKHFFRTQGIVFIMAVDKNHLCASVKNLYGNEINFSEYYRKFVHRNVPFPDFSENAIESYTKSKLDEYFKSRQKFLVSNKIYTKDNIRDNIVMLCMDFNLSPRQMNEMFRILSHFLGCQEENGQGTVGWIIAAIFYSVIHLSDENISYSISKGSYKYSKFIELLDKGLINKESNSKQYFAEMFLYIFSNSNESIKDNKKIFCDKFKKNAETIEDSPNQELLFGTKDILHDVRDSVMQQVAKKIDECLTFFD